MKTQALLSVAPLLVAHALGACTGMNAADQGVCPTEQCVTMNESFGSASALAAAGVSKGDANFVSEQSPDNAAVSSGNLVLSLVKSDGGYTGSTVYFTRWIHYGTITAVVRSGSTAPGVVSSFQLQSDDGSSIDLDWVGASSNRVQANYYTKGQIDLAQASAPILSSDPTGTFIEYKIVWQPDTLTWYANGLAIRTVRRKDTWAEGEQQYRYPDQPARLSFAIWDSGVSANAALTQAWAGSMQTTGGAEYAMAVKSVSVQCYSNSSAAVQSSLKANDDADDSDGASLDAEQRGSAAESSAKEDLSDFGLDRGESKASASHSSSFSSSVSDGEDEVESWLAGLNISAAPAQRLGASGFVGSSLIAAGLVAALLFGI